jgi:ATP-dependent RNA helicase RhlE
MTSSTITSPSNTFAQLGLSEPLLRALTEKKYTQPSPIQAEAIPHLLAGRDLMGSAQTGTGKTAAFALPILQRLSESLLPRTPNCPRALILTPTRELAVQIGTNFSAYGKHLPLRHVVIFGGVGQEPQVRALVRGVDVCIATPGRLLDLAQQGYVRFDNVEIFVLDEADRMLDMGFAPDVKRIISRLKPDRQSLLFSATMPSAILSLARSILRNPVRVEMTPESPTAERVKQSVYQVQSGGKYPLLRHILNEQREGLILIFGRTKHGSNKLAKNLGHDGYRCEVIHGNKSQGARQRALESFRTGSARILVATDVAARGIDVKGISLVINYDIPHEPEAYVHRIGRTARAGAEGLAIAFCSPEERSNLRGIQRLIRQEIPVVALPQINLETPKRAPAPRHPASSQPIRREEHSHRAHRAEPARHAEPTSHPRHTEPASPARHAEPVQHTRHSEPVHHARHAEPAHATHRAAPTHQPRPYDPSRHPREVEPGEPLPYSTPARHAPRPAPAHRAESSHRPAHASPGGHRPRPGPAHSPARKVYAETRPTQDSHAGEHASAAPRAHSRPHSRPASGGADDRPSGRVGIHSPRQRRGGHRSGWGGWGRQ